MSSLNWENKIKFTFFFSKKFISVILFRIIKKPTNKIIAPKKYEEIEKMLLFLGLNKLYKLNITEKIIALKDIHIATLFLLLKLYP